MDFLKPFKHLWFDFENEVQLVASQGHDIADAIHKNSANIGGIWNVSEHSIEIECNIMQQLAIKPIIHPEAHGMDGVHEFQFLLQNVQGSNFSIFWAEIRHTIREK